MDKSSLMTHVPNTHVIKYSYSLFDIDKGMSRQEVAITLILYAEQLTTNPYSTRLSLNRVLHKSIF